MSSCCPPCSRTQYLTSLLTWFHQCNNVQCGRIFLMTFVKTSFSIYKNKSKIAYQAGGGGGWCIGWFQTVELSGCKGVRSLFLLAFIPKRKLSSLMAAAVLPFRRWCRCWLAHRECGCWLADYHLPSITTICQSTFCRRSNSIHYWTSTFFCTKLSLSWTVLC